MERESRTPKRYIQDRRIVYERLYEQGLNYLNRKAQRDQQLGEYQDPECTFKPNLSKSKLLRNQSREKSPRNGITSKSPRKNQKSKSQSKIINESRSNMDRSPRSKFAINKDIENLTIKGQEKSFLDEARLAAEKRAKQFDERFGQIKKANNQRKVVSPKNQLIFADFYNCPVSPMHNHRQHSPQQSNHKVQQIPLQKSPKTKILSSLKNMKFPLIIDQSYIEEAIKIILQKGHPVDQNRSFAQKSHHIDSKLNKSTQNIRQKH